MVESRIAHGTLNNNRKTVQMVILVYINIFIYTTIVLCCVGCVIPKLTTHVCGSRLLLGISNFIVAFRGEVK